MKIKTNELSGAALDWAVAKCEGYAPVFSRHYVTPSHAEDPKKVCIPAQSWVQPFEPSTNWAQGGPIIERERILLQPEIGKENAGNAWSAISLTGCVSYGPTPLIAAIRCYVASKLGDEVEVPDELIKENQP